MYFSKFPILNYPIKDGETFKTVYARNILRRIVLSGDLKSSDAAFIEYSVKDGERPEHIAEKLYGDPNYHWLVLLTNDTIDPHHGWYKSDSVMQEYIQAKYSGYSVYFTDHGGNFLYSSQIGSGATLVQGSISGTIKNYQETLCKLSVDVIGYSKEYTPPSNPGATPGLATIQGLCGGLISIRIHRVDPSFSSVHHFSQVTGNNADGTPIESRIDPVSKYYSTYSYLQNDYLGATLDGEIKFYDTYIGKYMGISGSPNTNFVVTNQAHENNSNNTKRTIKLIHPRLKDRAMQELESLLRV